MVCFQLSKSDVTQNNATDSAENYFGNITAEKM